VIRHRGSYWAPYLDAPPDLARFPKTGLIADVGCGTGEQLTRLRDQGYRAVGIEPLLPAAREARHLGHLIVVAKAEQLPLRQSSCVGVLCKVVLPYTDECRAVGEMTRVLCPGGVALITMHGLGYSLRYLIQPDEWRHALYAARTILNTITFRLTGRRLPGFLGDTLYQSPRRMHRYYRANGLSLEANVRSKSFLGQPVFFGQVLRK
jgi:SAM-dependent methyltransferase